MSKVVGGVTPVAWYDRQGAQGNADRRCDIRASKGRLSLGHLPGRVCMVITHSKSKDQPGKVANPARGELNRENQYFPVPVRA